MFLRYLLSRSIRIEEDLVGHLFNSSEKRLARVLLLLANFGKESKPETVIPKISQETLAEIIGTTRSRVSFHEQVPQDGVHRLQRPPGSSQLTVECRPARLRGVWRRVNLEDKMVALGMPLVGRASTGNIY